MKRIVIAGGSGFLGQIIVKHYISLGFEVIVLTRQKIKSTEDVKYLIWDGKTIDDWVLSLNGADILVNLTGKSVDCRYNVKNKKEIYDSRLDSTTILGKAIEKMKSPPTLWINASSATIYRHSIDKDMVEISGELGEGFSVDVCQKWEKSFNQAPALKTRKVILRIGIVLGKNGGALVPLKNLVNIGLGGKQGKGTQYFSWIHEKDFLGILNYIIDREHLSGVFNVTSPNPLPNKQVMRLLRKIKKNPFGLPLSKILLEIGAKIIGTETELILKSRRVVPQRLIKEGYCFQFDQLESALIDLD